MFGTIPKVLWNKVSPSDRQNRIRLAVTCLLIKVDDKCVLVDTGLGDKFNKKLREIYKFERGMNLIKSLAQYGVRPEEVDYVINTHLHFDHCGGNTRRAGDKYVPTFPGAKYIIQQQEWFSAQNTDEKTRSSYRLNDFTPLDEAGQVEFVDGDFDVMRGIRVLLTNGHTLGHQSVLIEDGKNSALYLGDIIPTAHHLKPHYLTGFDLYPVDLISRKKEIVEAAVRENYLLIFEHDPNVTFARLEQTDGVVKVVPFNSENDMMVERKPRRVTKGRSSRKKKRLSK